MNKTDLVNQVSQKAVFTADTCCAVGSSFQLVFHGLAGWEPFGYTRITR